MEMGRKLLDAAPTASLTQMKESKHLEQMKHFQNIAALCETISDDDGSLLKWKVAEGNGECPEAAKSQEGLIWLQETFTQ